MLTHLWCAAQLVGMLGERVVGEVDTQQLHADALVGHLATEAENGRLLRILARLSFICERPDADTDSQWSETGAAWRVHPGYLPILATFFRLLYCADLCGGGCNVPCGP